MKLKHKIAAMGVAVIATLGGARVATAAPVTFAFAGLDTVTFDLPDSPTISPGFDADSFSIKGIDAYFAIPNTHVLMDAYFLDSAVNGGGIVLNYADTASLVFSSYGAQLFGGTVASPTFSPGLFQLSELGTPEIATITPAAPSAAPEPGTWALMIGGIGLAGLALRRRRREGRAFAPA